MESKEYNSYVWKMTESDGTVPVRRLEDSSKELEKKKMKDPPSKSDKALIEEGLVKNIKKLKAISFVDEKTERKFKDSDVLFCKSL